MLGDIPLQIPEDCVSQKEVAEMTLLHVEEMIKLQDQYELVNIIHRHALAIDNSYRQRLKSLSENLTKLKREKAQEVEQLEQGVFSTFYSIIHKINCI